MLVDELGSLIVQLRSSSAGERRRACELLTQIGKTTREAIPTLADLTKDTNAPVRASAASALAAIGAFEPQAIVALAGLLEDQSPKVIFAALEGLEAAGPDAAIALPQLARMLDGPDWMVMGQVILTLASIGPAATPVAPKLLSFLQAVPPGLIEFFRSRPTDPRGAELAIEFWYRNAIQPTAATALQAMGYNIPQGSGRDQTN